MTASSEKPSGGADQSLDNLDATSQRLGTIELHEIDETLKKIVLRKTDMVILPMVSET